MNPRPFSRRRSAGFTLIELLTVIAIIGILAAILIPVVGKVRNSARSASTVSSARQVASALMLVAGEERGRFPLGDINNMPNGQRFWPRRVADALGMSPAVYRDAFLPSADQVTDRSIPLSTSANAPTSFMAHQFLLGSGTFADGRVTRSTSNPGIPVASVRRPSETVLVITGEPLVGYSASTGLSSGATATFNTHPWGSTNQTTLALDTPISPAIPGNNNGFEQIGYYIGASGTPVARDGGGTRMSYEGRAVAAMVDGSVRQFRQGEILVRHVNVVR